MATLTPESCADVAESVTVTATAYVVGGGGGGVCGVGDRLLLNDALAETVIDWLNETYPVFDSASV
jgi:hypothetical protein